MKLSTKLFASIIIGSFLGACSLFTSYQQEEKTANALLLKQDSLQKTFNSIDVNKITEIGETTLAKLDSLMTIVEEKNLVLEKDDAIFLGRYRSLSKPYRKLDETQQYIVFDLNLSKKQLENLSKDIKNKSIPKDSVSLFLKEESEALELVEGNIEALKRSKTSVEKEYDECENEIKRIFKKIEAK